MEEHSCSFFFVSPSILCHPDFFKTRPHPWNSVWNVRPYAGRIQIPDHPIHPPDLLIDQAFEYRANHRTAAPWPCILFPNHRVHGLHLEKRTNFYGTVLSYGY